MPRRETIYDLCAGETTDGHPVRPRDQRRPGWHQVHPGPDFSAIYSAVGFCQTEAQAIAGTTKPCYEVPCPPFVEVRLDACGICIKVPILTNAAYPELVQRWLSGALIAHQHKMNAKVIARDRDRRRCRRSGHRPRRHRRPTPSTRCALVADGHPAEVPPAAVHARWRSCCRSGPRT